MSEFNPNTTAFPVPSVAHDIAEAAFNSSMFNIMLLGFYSVIYVYTMCIYLSRKGIPRANMAIIATVTALYLVNVAMTAGTWIATREDFMSTIGQPVDALFFAVFVGNTWLVLLNNCGTVLSIGLADGLLIWRCYHVWGQSKQSIVLPIIFLLAETALSLAAIIIACMHDLDPSPSAVVLLNHLTSAAIFMSLGCTLLTTALIAYPIYSMAQECKDSLPRTPFASILDAIVQSAAAYTLFSFFYEIEGVMPFTSSTGPTIFILEGYTFPMFSTAAGVAPTVMVARVTLLARRDTELSTTNRQPLSDLEFNPARSSGTGPSRSAPAHVESANAEKSLT